MNIEILKDVVIIFALSTFVNFLFTKIKVPTLIGYLLTGVVAGPFLLGIISNPHEIELMAELGVVILMFTIGMEFSLKHLLKIRRIVFLGGFIQLSLTALSTMVLARSYNMEWKAALFIGFLTALSSTAVVLKILQDRSEVTSNYGRTVVGILIFQDIVLVPMLLFTPFLKGETTNLGSDFIALMIKAILIIGFVYVGNKWVIPKLLHRIAMTRNQELFLMSVLLICLSVALLTSTLGITLAFGAFLAGLMISESEYSDNAFSNLIPFRDTFTSFFFVSIGMLLDLHFVYQNIGLVLFTVLLVIGIKIIIAGFTAFLMGHTFRGTVLVGIALAQVGEFSFILAKMGTSYKILTDFYYQLFLAVAIITMSVSPLLIQLGRPIAGLLLKLPLPAFLVKGLFPLHQIDIPKLGNHLVLIGKDSRAINLSVMAKYNNIPYISIVFDPAIVRKRQEKGDSVIYGDAVNEPILLKAHVDTAKIVVISIGDLITAMAVTEKVRSINKHAFILVRTKHVEDIEELYRLGANQVIPEEFETAIDLFERVLTKFLVPQNEINSTIGRIRDDNYGIFYDKYDNSLE
ncbi:MAG: cation:proton antiporter [Mariniphaga sp.]